MEYLGKCNWKWMLLGGVASAGCLYLSYRLGRYHSLKKAATVYAQLKSYSVNTPLNSYVLSHNLEDDVLSRLRAMSVQHKWGEMTTSVDVGKLLTILCRAVNARRVLDVGVFTGCSAFAMALGLPDDGKIIACDISEEYTSLGKPYWVEGGVADKIDLRLKPAVETLQELLDAGEAESFDLMFIDADKANYVNYFRLGLQLLRPGGLILVDNAIWRGKVADPEIQDETTIAIRKMNEAMKNEKQVDFVLLNVCDGIGIGQKIASPQW